MKKQDSMRARAGFAVDIACGVREIFPLACPVEEMKWINNWDYTMVYSESGKNELGCIFFEEMSAQHLLGPEHSGKTFWITTRFDEEHHVIHFLLAGSGTAARLEITMEEIETGTSRITWDMTLTSIEENVNSKFDESIQDRMTLMLNFLARSLKHYCETGSKLVFGN